VYLHDIYRSIRADKFRYIRAMHRGSWVGDFVKTYFQSVNTITRFNCFHVFLNALLHIYEIVVRKLSIGVL
jgi:hypothetical protein